MCSSERNGKKVLISLHYSHSPSPQLGYSDLHLVPAADWATPTSTSSNLSSRLTTFSTPMSLTEESRKRWTSEDLEKSCLAPANYFNSYRPFNSGKRKSGNELLVISTFIGQKLTMLSAQPLPSRSLQRHMFAELPRVRSQVMGKDLQGKYDVKHLAQRTVYIMTQLLNYLFIAPTRCGYTFPGSRQIGTNYAYLSSSQKCIHGAHWVCRVKC